ncbi:MAG: anti-sigma factor [Gemmatimonadales bacterium]|nr:MAG: anti-sigma factor [Gemmatimonadales bacterium]
MAADRFQELCEAFLLSGLEGEELSAFQEELDRRGREGELALERTMEALGLLALTARQETPPPALRERLMAEIRADAAPVSTPSPRAEPSKPVTPLRPRESPVASWVWPSLMAAAVAATVLLGVWNLNLRSELTDRTAALDAARQEVAAVENLRGELAALRQDLGTIVAPAGSIITMAGTDTRPDARARIYVDPETGRALVLAFELPVLAAESIYQLWAIRDGQPVSLGTFAARDDGPARLALDSLDPVAGADLLAVTIEPAPGQPAPTGEMVLVSGD